MTSPSDPTLIQLYNFDSLSLNQTNEENDQDLLAANLTYRIKFEKASEEILAKATKRISIPLKLRKAQRKKRGATSHLVNISKL